MVIGHFIGMALVLAIMAGTGLLSMRKVKTAEDFNLGGGHGSVWMVSGMLLGALVGGQSTIGTAQLSYSYGLSAIWFTFGLGLGTILLGILLVPPLRKRREITLMEIIRTEFGEKAEYIGTILCSVGMLVAVVSNILASSALIMALTGIPLPLASLVSICLMGCYVVFGGVLGAEMGGIVKIILLLAAAFLCTLLILKSAWNAGSFEEVLPLHLSDLFSRGVGTDLCKFISAVLGVLSTQTYAQAVWSAKNYHAARKATILSGFLCIPVGFVSVMIGCAMRGSGIDSPAEAFPAFLLDNLPPLAAGVCLGTLLITVVTAGGGLVLGASTIFVRDIISKIYPSSLHGRAQINTMRITMLSILAVCGLLSVLLTGTFINDLGFLSLGLRATVIFIPLMMALFFTGRFRKEPILAAMIAGPCTMLFTNLVWAPADPLVCSMLVCLLICISGYRR